MMATAFTYCFLFWWGGLIYCGIELLWRKKTHPSMFFAGGLSVAAIHWISGFLWDHSKILTLLLCGSAITLIEFAVGVVVNIKLKLNVWDYSDQKGNIMGQVCPLYTIYWVGLSLPAVFLCNLCRTLF